MAEKKLSNAISNIAWGYVLLHLEINMGPIDLLPDWLAYIMFYSAINTIKEDEPSAELLHPLVIILGAWDVVTIFIQDIQMISLIIAVISLYFHFQFLTNLANIATKYGCLENEKILTLRTVRTILLTVFAIPVAWDSYRGITIVLLVANLVVAIWICSVLFSLKKSLRLREDSNEVE